MSTRNVVPRADGEGGLGTATKNWNEVRAKHFYKNGVELYSSGAYSTTEQRIGTWIDGNPLYQKTLSLEHINVQPMSASLADSVIDTTFLTSIQKDKIVKFDYICRVVGVDEYAGSFGYESDEDLEFQFNNEITLRQRWGPTPQLCDVYITVQYTKTTD
jgi:hypothetical protein